MNPIDIYKSAAKKVPQLKYFLAVAAVIGLIVIVYGWIKNENIPWMVVALGFLFMVAGAVIIILIASMTRSPKEIKNGVEPDKDVRIIGLFFFWSVSVLVVGVMFTLMSAALFDQPHLFESIHPSSAVAGPTAGDTDPTITPIQSEVPRDTTYSVSIVGPGAEALGDLIQASLPEAEVEYKSGSKNLIKLENGGQVNPGDLPGRFRYSGGGFSIKVNNRRCFKSPGGCIPATSGIDVSKAQIMANIHSGVSNYLERDNIQDSLSTLILPLLKPSIQ
ncbi:hypothetical protein KFE98_20130 [bacterium SCSIO 12741]|nr:hypothetical protein KFE98_20130 [bacterium SCSIO 12741]